MNIEQTREYGRDYYHKNKAKIRKRQNERSENNREEKREYDRVYMAKYYHAHKNDPVYMAKKNVLQKRASESIKQRTIDLYGGKCANPACGDEELSVLSIDHIHNDGCEERRKNKHEGGTRQYCELLRTQKRNDIQVLCMSCQFRKIKYGNDFSKWPEKGKRTKLSPLPLG